MVTIHTVRALVSPEIMLPLISPRHYRHVSKSYFQCLTRSECRHRGAVATFATEGLYSVLTLLSPVHVLTIYPATGFSKAFPGIRPHLLTLASNFQIPLYRDILLALGMCSVSKKSCSNILKAGPGSAITIVVGGAAESLASRPGTADLTLRRRLGFIKIAIIHGCADPSITFEWRLTLTQRRPRSGFLIRRKRCGYLRQFSPIIF